MAKLEDLRPNAVIRGVLPNALVTVFNVQWFGSESVEPTCRTAAGNVADELLDRHGQPRLKVVEQGRPWRFHRHGDRLRLAAEARRFRLTHFFDPVLARHIWAANPLPYQVTSLCQSTLQQQPLRCSNRPKCLRAIPTTWSARSPKAVGRLPSLIKDSSVNRSMTNCTYAVD